MTNRDERYADYLTGILKRRTGNEFVPVLSNCPVESIYDDVKLVAFACALQGLGSLRVIFSDHPENREDKIARRCTNHSVEYSFSLQSSISIDDERNNFRALAKEDGFHLHANNMGTDLLVWGKDAPDAGESLMVQSPAHDWFWF